MELETSSSQQPPSSPARSGSRTSTCTPRLPSSPAGTSNGSGHDRADLRDLGDLSPARSRSRSSSLRPARSGSASSLSRSSSPSLAGLSRSSLSSSGLQLRLKQLRRRQRRRRRKVLCIAREIAKEAAAQKEVSCPAGMDGPTDTEGTDSGESSWQRHSSLSTDGLASSPARSHSCHPAGSSSASLTSPAGSGSSGRENVGA
jgi:hypothetical protein